jgi:hypothetical protein
VTMGEMSVLSKPQTSNSVPLSSATQWQVLSEKASGTENKDRRLRQLQ